MQIPIRLIRKLAPGILGLLGNSRRGGKVDQQTVDLAAKRSKPPTPRLTRAGLAKSAVLLVNIAFALSSTRVVDTVLLATAVLFLPWLLLVLWSFQRRRGSGRKSLNVRREIFLGPTLLLLERPAVCEALVLVGTIAAALLGPASWFSLSLAVAFGLVAGVVAALGHRLSSRFQGGWLIAVEASAVAGLIWLAGLPIWTGSTVVAIGLVVAGIAHYLLSFCDRDGEADADAAVVSGVIGFGLASLDLPPTLRAACIVAPVGAYVVYCERVRDSLNAFKATLRGMAAQSDGNSIAALEFFSVARRFSPNSDNILKHYWDAHRAIDLTAAAEDPRLASLIDPIFCLEHVRQMLDGSPSVERTAEARHLLNLVERREPERRFAVLRQRAIAALADGNVDDAIALLTSIRDRTTAQVQQLSADEANELAACWLLAMTEPRLIGAKSLDWLEGAGLFRCLCVLHRAAASNPKASELLAFLYRKIDRSTVSELRNQEPNADVSWIAMDRILEAAADLASQDQTVQAMEVYAVAASLSAKPIAIWKRLADLTRTVDPAQSRKWLSEIRDRGRTLLPDGLSKNETTIFVATCRQLADDAEAATDSTEAIYNLELLAATHQDGEPTLRRLLNLYEALGDRLNAIRQVEAALVYSLPANSRNQWLVAKQRLYDALDPQTLADAPIERRRHFDFAYCLDRARILLKSENPDAHALAERYLRLAQLGGPDWIMETAFLQSRIAVRQGRFAEAAGLLEKARAAKPKKFRSAEQRQAFFDTTKLLGEIYLDHLDRPADAVPCLIELEKEVESGAGTLLKLGQAYERTGDLAKARKWYDMVLVYPKNPAADLAKSALDRLGNRQPK